MLFNNFKRFFQNSQEIDICGRACKDSSECPEDPPSKIKECVSGKCKVLKCLKIKI